MYTWLQEGSNIALRALHGPPGAPWLSNCAAQNRSMRARMLLSLAGLSKKKSAEVQLISTKDSKVRLKA